jgi:hypothetical protein
MEFNSCPLYMVYKNKKVTVVYGGNVNIVADS